MKRLALNAQKSLPALVLALLAVGPLSGCSGYYYGEKYGSTLGWAQGTDLVGSSYAAVSRLYYAMQGTLNVADDSELPTYDAKQLLKT